MPDHVSVAHERAGLEPVLTDGSGLRLLRGLVLRLVASTVVAGVLAAPLAVGWAVSRTEVSQTVGVTPTTFSLTTAGRSELRLGLAGTLYIPRANGPFGVVATVVGPAVPQGDQSDLAAYVTPDMLELYTGLFHDPEPAVAGYLDLLQREVLRQLASAELFLASVGGVALLALRLLLFPGERARPRLRRGGLPALAVALAVTTSLAFVQARPATAGGPSSDDPGVYSLPSLDGTVAEGTTTNSPLLRLLLGGAVPKVRSLVERQEERVRSYRETASASLQRQGPRMVGPRDGETAVLMQSDMHCNTTMVRLQRQVVSLLRSRYGPGVPALLAITGDLTTNGTAAEGGCIRDEADVAQGAPVVAVTGNHESEESVEQMKDAGMTVLDGGTEELAGVSVLGDGDPDRSELFGATQLRGDETQHDVGARLYDAAASDRPDLVLVHEAYAAEAFIGASDMTDFLSARGDPTSRREDDVRDLPTSAVLYGHWHRSIEPRVVWNSDGTWTLVMELDTSGGAIDTPTIGEFSTPWSRPAQEASFPVLFLDDETGLVRAYQLYRFDVDGRVTVQPRVDVGEETADAVRR